MARKGTGGVVGVANTPTTSIASGIWTMFEQARWKNAGAWPAAPTVPGAPTIGTATATNAQATVTFSAPASNGGSAITQYTVTSTPGNITATGSGSPITVTGLINGASYTFKVKATNAVGTGAESAASNSVTPSALVDPSTVEALVVAGGGGGGFSYGCGGGAGGLLYGSSVPVTPGTSYTVTVGAGGAFATGGSAGAGSNGSNSVFIGTANGGGAGGANGVNGNNGGSGGGNGGAATQGNSGGLTGFGSAGVAGRSNAGGGAGGTGSTRVGGPGKQYIITGTNTAYAGGGSGEGAASQPDGGGNFPNKGGGGRGDAQTSLPYQSGISPGNGGSGVVVIAYSATLYKPIANISAGLTYTYDSNGGFHHYVFTGGTGTISW